MADRNAQTSAKAGITASSLTKLNLASDPQGGYRAFFALACLATFGLLLVTVALVATYAGSGGVPADLVERERQLLAERERLAALERASAATIQDPKTAGIVDRTAFLNELLVRKGVSWTRTLLDLESVLPANARILALRPEVAYGDTVLLDMTVGAKAPTDFIDFLKTLEGSELFRSPELRGSAPPDDGDPTYRYQLEVEYDQRL